MPTVPIANWIKNINDVFPIPSVNRVIEKANTLPTNNAARAFLNGMFWSTWIDQVLHYTLDENGGNAGIRLYEKFCQNYQFIKIEKNVSPAKLITSSPVGVQPPPDLLRLGKQAWWTDDIGHWLEAQRNGAKARERAEKEFRRDQKLPLRFNAQFNGHYGMLF